MENEGTDWQRMALDKVPVDFLGEVALRSLYTFVLALFSSRLPEDAACGRCIAVRGADYFDPRLGGGDVAFYDDVPMVPVLIVFITLALLYRGNG